MTAINLRKGLEFLAYFGEQDFDPQRNLLKDHSGYGRHATAKGGPTVGVNGPNDFEAASFDGNDDRLDAPTSIGREEVTVLYIGKLPSEQKEGIFNSPLATFTHSHFPNNNGGIISMSVFDNDSRRDVQVDYNSFHEFALNGIRFRKQKDYVDVIINGDISSRLNLSGNGNLNERQTDTTDEVRFGESKNSSLPNFSGDIALIGIWTRGITDRELDRLNDLTGQMRAQL